MDSPLTRIAMTGIELILGYTVGIGSNASWDLVKRIASAARDAGLDLETIWVRAFREAIRVHRIGHDRRAQAAVAPLGDAFERDPRQVASALRDVGARTYEDFFRSIEHREFQRDVADAVLRRYGLAGDVDGDLLAAVVTDVVGLFRLGVVRTISRDDQVRITFLQSLKIDGLSETLEALRGSVVTRGDLSAAAAEIRAQLADEVERLAAAIAAASTGNERPTGAPENRAGVDHARLLDALTRMLRARGYRPRESSRRGIRRCRSDGRHTRGAGRVHGAPAGPRSTADDVRLARDRVRSAVCDFAYLLPEGPVPAAASAESSRDCLVRVHTFDEFLNGLIDLQPYRAHLRSAFAASWVGETGRYVPIGCTRQGDGEPSRPFLDGRGTPVGFGPAAGGHPRGLRLRQEYVLFGSGRPARRGGGPIRRLRQDRRPRSPASLRGMGGVRGAVLHALASGGVEMTGAALDELLRAGRLTLILDGLDEITANTDRRTLQRELGAVAELAMVGDNRLVVTCRTHFFRDEHEEGRLGKCDVLYVAPWTPEALTTYLKQRSGLVLSASTEHLIVTPALRDICRTPLFAEMAVVAIEETGPHGLTLRRLFANFTDKWLREQDKRSRMELSEKRELLTALAKDMFHGGASAIHHDKLRRMIKKTFDLQTVDDIAGFDVDVRTCSFLTRDTEGNYRFVSRAFMEYFVAEDLAAELPRLTVAIRTDLSAGGFQLPPEETDARHISIARRC